MSILGHRPARKGEEDTRFSANHCSFLTRAGIGFWRCDYRLSERKGRAKKRKAKREQVDGAGHMVWLPLLMGIAYPRVLGDGKEATARTFYNAKGV